MKQPRLFRSYDRKSAKGKLYVGDALAFLRRIDDESTGIVFLDPPFNLGKRYIPNEPDTDRLPEAEYKEWLLTVIKESVRILVPGGALYLYHLPKWAMRIGAALEGDLELRHWIAISMKNGFARGQRLYPAHYALLYFTKGRPLTFARPRVPAATCRHCKKTIKDYGGYKSIIDAKGINLSDVWDDMSPVRHSGTKLRAENQLPLALTDRVMHISGAPGMTMVDPFAGSGTSLVSAAAHGLRFVACDVVRANCEIIHKRLAPNNRPTKRQGQ